MSINRFMCVHIALSCMRKNLEGRTGSLGQSRWHAVLLLAITKRATSQTIYSFCNHKMRHKLLDKANNHVWHKHIVHIFPISLYSQTVTNTLKHLSLCAADSQLCCFMNHNNMSLSKLKWFLSLACVWLVAHYESYYFSKRISPFVCYINWV